jgi:lysozyme
MSKITSIGKNGIKLIKFFESFFSKPYICPAGVNTIGFGTTRYFDTKARVTLKDKAITQAEADRLLLGDINLIYAPLVDKLCRDDLTQNEFDAVCSFVYNAGATYRGKDGLNHYFKLFDLVNRKVSQAELEAYWKECAVTGGGKKLNGLVKRRVKEVELYFTK